MEQRFSWITTERAYMRPVIVQTNYRRLVERIVG